MQRKSIAQFKMQVVTVVVFLHFLVVFYFHFEILFHLFFMGCPLIFFLCVIVICKYINLDYGSASLTGKETGASAVILTNFSF